MSGRARSKLSALRKYGLLDGRGESYRVSDRAMAIMFPEDPEEKAAAVRDAAMAPELFSELAGYDGASDDNLISRLMRIGFTRDGARIAVASFRETMSLVSGDLGRYDTGDVETPTVMTQPVAAAQRERPERREPDLVFSPTLRYGLYDGVVVEVKVSGGTLTSRQIDLLREYLALQEKAVLAAESAVAAPVSPATSEPEPLS